MNPTVVRLSVQALLGRRRFLLLLIIPAVMVALAVVVRALAGEGVGYIDIVSGLGLTLVVPLVALLATSSVLGPEVDDGSIVYLLAKPVNRYVVATSKLAVALAATIGFGALSLPIAGLVIDASRPGAAVAWFAAGLLASAAYCGLFLALSAVTRHAVVLGLLFVFLWEGLLGNLLSGVRWLSIGAWGRNLASAMDDTVALQGKSVGTGYLLVATVVLVLLTGWFAGERLRSFSMRGET